MVRKGAFGNALYPRSSISHSVSGLGCPAGPVRGSDGDERVADDANTFYGTWRYDRGAQILTIVTTTAVVYGQQQNDTIQIRSTGREEGEISGHDLSGRIGASVPPFILIQVVRPQAFRLGKDRFAINGFYLPLRCAIRDTMYWDRRRLYSCSTPCESDFVQPSRTAHRIFSAGPPIPFEPSYPRWPLPGACHPG